MRLLLDENLPERLRHAFESPIEAATVRHQGWSGKKNGDLLRSAKKAGFDVLLTVDRGFPSQQKVGELQLGIVLLETRSNRYTDLAPHVGDMLVAIRKVKPGQLLRVRL